MKPTIGLTRCSRLDDYLASVEQAGGLARLGDGLVQSVHEGEAGVGGSVVGRCVTMKNGAPNGLWPPQASAAS